MMLVYFSFYCLLLIMILSPFAKFPISNKVNLSYPTGKEMGFKTKLTLTLTLMTVFGRLSKFDIRNQNEVSLDKPINHGRTQHKMDKEQLGGPLTISDQYNFKTETLG